MKDDKTNKANGAEKTDKTNGVDKADYIKMRQHIKLFYKRGWFFIFYHDLCSVITNKE